MAGCQSIPRVCAQVSSIRQEFDSLHDRGIAHAHLVKYLGMKQDVLENRIVVEVRESHHKWITSVCFITLDCYGVHWWRHHC